MLDIKPELLTPPDWCYVNNFDDPRCPRAISIPAGRGVKLRDIEREVKLGGAIHSKGVLILSSFLAARYARNQPLSLAASLVFEQSYGLVDGDSASIADFPR